AGRRGDPRPLYDATRVVLAGLMRLDCGAPLCGTYHYGGHVASTPLVVGQAVYAEATHYRQFTLEGVSGIARADCPVAADEPQHGVLACKKIFNTFGIKPRAWRAGLPDLLDRYYRHD